MSSGLMLCKVPAEIQLSLCDITLEVAAVDDMIEMCYFTVILRSKHLSFVHEPLQKSLDWRSYKVVMSLPPLKHYVCMNV